MEHWALSRIDSQFPLVRKDIGGLHRLRIMGIGFDISAFRAKGLGHVSFMTARAPLGVMEMTTVIITPDEVNMPLCSVERMRVLGTHTLLMDAYDTLVKPCVYEEIRKAQAACADLPDYVAKPYWYDRYRLPEAYGKTGKKDVADRLSTGFADGLSAIVRECAKAEPCDRQEKRMKNAAFVEKMISEGGVSTSLFLKKLGKEKGGKFIREAVFGTV